MLKLRTILALVLAAFLGAGAFAPVPVEVPTDIASIASADFDFTPAMSPLSAQEERIEQFGVASWYGGRHHGRPTASGAIFDMNKLTAAHRSLPLGTAVRVTNLANGRAVDVTINDRGPYVHGRVIDLSHRAASDLAMVERGLAAVRIEVLSAVQVATQRSVN